jgi:ACS family hexuronate transporter-like MFS transporter
MQRPGSVQRFIRLWLPCASMLLLSLLSYADRSVLAILSPTILSALHLSATQYGYAVLAFSLAYMVANPLWGWWMDRRGLWLTVLAAVLLWSVASGAHAWVSGIVGLCVLRALLGFGEGATFPAGLSVVAQTLPAERRAFGLAVAYSGGSLGAALTPLLITPIALRWGWRAAFLMTALFGAVWMVLWIVMKAAGLLPVALPKAVQHVPDKVSAAKPRLTRNVVATACVYGLGAAPLGFGLYAAPLYLSSALHVSQASLGHVLWIPPAGWELGYLVLGRMVDRSRARGRVPTLALFAFFSVAGLIFTLIPLLAHSAHAVALTMLLFFATMFLTGGFVVVSLAHGMQQQGSGDAGFLAGSAISVWAIVTGLLMPLFGHFFDHGQYARSFWLSALLPFIGVAIWKVLQPRMPDLSRA